MDSLEIIATFVLEIGSHTEFKEQVKVYEAPLAYAEHHIDILGQDIM